MPFLSHVVETANLRLDRYVSEILRLFSRSQIKARGLKAKINGKDVKLSRPVKCGDILDLFWEESPAQDLIPQDIPMEVIHEDDKCIVINKAQGMVVHPGAGNRQGTLANAIYYRILNKNNSLTAENANMPSANWSLRPGIVHRLDKETSGVIIAAYDEESHEFLSRQFKNRKVRKTYVAIVQGMPKEKKGRIETFIARDPRDRKKFAVCTRGKNALTFYKVIKSWTNSLTNYYTLVMLRPRTGRTHQLRVHMRHIGCPILGDSVYGAADKNFPAASLMLHSKSLEITLPQETEPRIFSSVLPLRFRDIIEKLKKWETDNM